MIEELEKRGFKIVSISGASMGALMGGYPPDILIEISKDACNTYDFHKASEVITIGRMAAKEQLDSKGM